MPDVIGYRGSKKAQHKAGLVTFMIEITCVGCSCPLVRIDRDDSSVRGLGSPSPGAWSMGLGVERWVLFVYSFGIPSAGLRNSMAYHR